MPNQYTENTFESVYKDSHKDSDGYYKVLFNSGVPLQARELNEIQTIFQKQLGIFGKSIFIEGAAVNPNSGAVKYGSIQYVRLDPTVHNNNNFAGFTANSINYTKWTDLVGYTFRSSSAQADGTFVTFRVTKVLLAEDGDPITLYGTRSVEQGGTTISDQPSVPDFSAGDVITNATVGNLTVGPVSDVNGKIINPTGLGFYFGIQECDYFIKGYFVRATSQDIILSKYSHKCVTVSIGFEAFQDIVTVEDDEKLYDNQGPVPNRAAPGADRYRIRLVLSTRDGATDVNNWVEFAQIRESRLGRVKQEGQDFNQPEKRDAERHYLTHGDFISRPYKIEFEPGPTSDKLHAFIYDGQAFVQGIYNNNILKRGDYEGTFKEGTLVLDDSCISEVQNFQGSIPKPTSTWLDSDINSFASRIGNYIIVSNDSAGIGHYDVGLVSSQGTNGRISPHIQHYLFDESNTKIGKCYVRSAFKAATGNYQFYLYDIKMDLAANFRNVEKISTDITGATNYITPTLENGQLYLQEPALDNLLFPLPYTRPKNVVNATLETMRQFGPNAVNVSNQITIEVILKSGETFEDVANWIFLNADSTGVPTVTGSTITGSGSQAESIITLGNVTNGDNIITIAKVQKTDVNHKTKTLTTANFTGTKATAADSDGVIAVNFSANNAYDGVKLVSAWYLDGGSDSVDITSGVSFDNGQRDNFYKKFKLIVNNTDLVPAATNITARVEYFEWGATGDFFSVNSYTHAGSNIAYNKIPSYTTTGGVKYSLRDVLDFRSKYRGANEADYLEIPPGGNDLITTDYIEYYQGRIDIFGIKPDPTSGLKQIIFRKAGVEAPPHLLSTPDVPGNALSLFSVEYGPNTLNSGDVTVNRFRHKRYRMKDIQRLEDRVATVEETTSLSFLEATTQALSFTDTQGFIRTKTGTFVENFRSGLLRTGDEVGPVAPIGEWSGFSLNHPDGQLMPNTRTNEVSLFFDSNGSSSLSNIARSNVIRKADTVYLDYTQVQDPSLRQELISGAVNVNPFNVFKGEGALTLTPGTDFWVEKRRIADNIVQGGIEINRVLSPDLDDNYNWWKWGWQGDLSDLGNARGRSSSGRGAGTDIIVSASEATGARGFEVFSDNFTGEVKGGRTVTNARVGWNTAVFVQVTDTLISDEIKYTPQGDRTIVAISVPWMRSRKVFFKAEGLRPLTRYFPFFDGIRFDQWTRTIAENEYKTHAETYVAPIDTDPTIKAHPDYNGSGTYDNLISDAFGVIYGTIWIPNNAPLPSDEKLGFTNEQEWIDWVNEWTQLSAAGDYGGPKDPAIYDQLGWKFRVGEREFKLLDVSVDDEDAALSRAAAPYTATGSLEVKQRDVLATRVLTYERTARIEERRVDPLAQTFYIDPQLAPAGVFISSVDVFLVSWPESGDPNQRPIQLQIRSVRDGTPRTEVHPQLRVYKSAADVRTATSGLQNRRLYKQGDGTEENPNLYPGYTDQVDDVIAKPVNFEFVEPVYLQAGKEYAIVLLAETDNYEAAIAKTYSFYLNDTTKRISKQPAAGSLFLSQNSSTWTPDQTSDMAYRIYTAKFKPSGQCGFFNAPIPKFRHGIPSTLSATTGDSAIGVYQPGHGLGVGDIIGLEGLDSNSTYAGIAGSTFLAPNVLRVDSADWYSYSFKVDSAATATVDFGGDSVATNQNFYMDRACFNSVDFVPTDTTLTYLGNFITGVSHARINDTKIGDPRYAIGGSGYLTSGETITFASPRMVACEDNELDNSIGFRSVRLQANLTTGQRSGFGGTLATSAIASGYVSDVSPVLDLQGKSLIAINHVIDNQDSAGNRFDAPSYVNRPFNFLSETTGGGRRGSSLSKWISKPIGLPSVSNGLRVFVEAYVPIPADIKLMYRTNAAINDIYTNSWTYAEIEGTAPPKETFQAPSGSVPLKIYSYLIGGVDGFDSDQGLDFTEFQLKLLMNSTNTSQIPIIDNIRAIALL
jgi:hypothetical protein